MTIYEKIYDMINNSVDDIFREIQEEYGVSRSNCPDDFKTDIEDDIHNLTKHIEMIINYQKNM